MFAMRCNPCGHTAPMDDFCKTPIGGDLPHGTYQCPACRVAFRREIVGKATVYPSGLVIPAPVRIVACEGRL